MTAWTNTRNHTGEPARLGPRRVRKRALLAFLFGLLIWLGPVYPGWAGPNAPDQLDQKVFLPFLVISGQVKRPIHLAGPVVPELEAFAAKVSDGQAGVLKGVYAPGLFAYTVVQQPADDPGAITTAAGQVTQFQAAQLFGVTGLLAHNHLAGKQFFQLREGQTIILIAGDGASQVYQVRSADQYQALSPTDPYSRLVHLNSGETFTYDQVFARFYMDPGQLVFQTCIEQAGEPAWGRIFVVADPIE